MRPIDLFTPGKQTTCVYVCACSKRLDYRGNLQWWVHVGGDSDPNSETGDSGLPAFLFWVLLLTSCMLWKRAYHFRIGRFWYMAILSLSVQVNYLLCVRYHQHVCLIPFEVYGKYELV